MGEPRGWCWTSPGDQQGAQRKTPRASVQLAGRKRKQRRPRHRLPDSPPPSIPAVQPWPRAAPLLSAGAQGMRLLWHLLHGRGWELREPLPTEARKQEVTLPPWRVYPPTQGSWMRKTGQDLGTENGAFAGRVSHLGLKEEMSREILSRNGVDGNRVPGPRDLAQRHGARQKEGARGPGGLSRTTCWGGSRAEGAGLRG